MNDLFNAQTKPSSKAGELNYYSLKKLAQAGFPAVDSLPDSIKVLLESCLRNLDNFQVTEQDVKNLADWKESAVPSLEVPFKPARVILQDFTGVPAVVDLAAMRSAISRARGDAKKINPLVPVDLVIDHSVQVDYFASDDAQDRNVTLEFERNRERY
jgi:aconitate hydratase